MKAPSTWRGKLRGWRRYLIGAYAALLIASHLVRASQSNQRRQPSHHDNAVVSVQAIEADRPIAQTVTMAYRVYQPDDSQTRPTVFLLHGSPGQKDDFLKLAPLLARSYRVIAVDLPGFGASSRDIPDYSIRAHARYLLQMMDRLNTPRAHFVGFSMGGGVILNLAEIAPERVASLTLLSAIGVQEAELLGDYHLNHALHGLQLAILWLAHEAIPHFGWFAGSMFDLSYARNFYDSDQRPLRGILRRYAGPMLILHGERDVLVPVEAAREHARLVPQSEAKLLDDDHFMVFTDASKLAEPINAFLARVEAGQAVTRSNADTARVAQAAKPFDPANVPKAMGVTALVMILLLAAATLVSEDLTCISAGVLAAQGRIDLGQAIFACFLGIFAGDILLFLAGRYLGRPALRRAPLKWFVRDEAVERSSAWFARRGVMVILLSRFTPGARLPTYFAAGALNTSFWSFTFYFSLAAALWTPLLVALSKLLGAEALESALLANQSFFIKALIAGFVAYCAIKFGAGLATWRGRRRLVSRWRRLTRWEFWPPYVFYLPVICYVAWLALKWRSLTLFTAANPAIMGGGFIGESKIEILRGLAHADGFVAQAALIEAALDAESRISQAVSFMTERGLSFPIALKPDQGQRGTGVAIARTKAELTDYLRQAASDTIIQEYAPGFEFGVFYYRLPGEASGRIFSITEKRMPVIYGDGASTLEQLILKDERAVCMAEFHLNQHRARLWETPRQGEPVQLVELGTHCRGAIFLDGGWVKTPALEEAFDRISRGFDGFYFGRYDVRAPSVDDFKQGRNFKIVELNGVTSEATNIYDPKNSLFAAYKILFEQWRLAFEIGAHNRQRGAQPTPISALVKLITNSVEPSNPVCQRE
jgi:pimeloyl-ACP methyl ester carboxylesterase/membrane protein DedA with SNARE-associated domain